ncbi:hypothetical protein, partial [Stenotrophomonas maltophilia group sp. RNC7]|uniref:hypothetical protein n=1 Tax=Stenotrophomonas maltophilia group sp. RNC7 TaxID=3071467 RepID=UPI0027E0B493
DYDIINYNDGSIKIIDSVSEQTIFETNLVKEGYIDNAENLKLYITGSNTKRYLQLRDLYSRLNILIDIKNKTIINIPIEGERVIKWSPSDERVIIYLIGFDDEYPDDNIYLWDIENRNIEKIGEFNNRPLQWIPDEEYILFRLLCSK